MGLIMEERCNLNSIKYEPGEVITIDEISNSSYSEQAKVAVKQEEISLISTSIEVKSEHEGINVLKPCVVAIKERKYQEEGDLECNDVITSKIKLELDLLKPEEIDIKDEDDAVEETGTTTMYTCNVCGYKTTIKNKFKVHISFHMREKIYKCEKCEYSSKSKRNLQSHLKTHCKRKSFICLLCKYAAYTKDALKNHVLIHSGEKPFECYTCGHKTPSKNNLRKHVKIHLGSRIKKFKCNACKNRFLYKSSLLRHISVRPCKPLLN